MKDPGNRSAIKRGPNYHRQVDNLKFMAAVSINKDHKDIHLVYNRKEHL